MFRLIPLLCAMVAFGFGVALRLVDMESRFVLIALMIFGVATGDLVLRAYLDLGNPHG